MSEWLLDLLATAADRLNADVSAFEEQYQTGRSFECWATSRLCEALRADPNVFAFPEVGYTGFCGEVDGNGQLLGPVEPTSQAADILIGVWGDKRLAIGEAAIVLPGTQSKWKAKIAWDFQKLQVANKFASAKFLVVYSFSSDGKVVGPDGWNYWFDQITLLSGAPLGAPDIVKAYPFSEMGEWAIQVWLAK